MTRAEKKRQLLRVEKAAKYVQKRLNTHYHLIFDFISLKTRQEIGPDSILCTYLSRGSEDLMAWTIDIDPEKTSTLKWREVLLHVEHELAHCILGRLADIIPQGKTKGEKQHILAVEENVAYQLGRVFQYLIHGNIIDN